jgi:hypothetical protein
MHLDFSLLGNKHVPLGVISQTLRNKLAFFYILIILLQSVLLAFESHYFFVKDIFEAESGFLLSMLGVLLFNSPLLIVLFAGWKVFAEAEFSRLAYFVLSMVIGSVLVIVFISPPPY